MTFPQSPGNRPLVLVVDDDATIRLLTKASLEQHGFEVMEAEDGEVAVHLVQQTPPDIILLDVMMPRMDGYAACAAIRQLPVGEALPIVMVTALEDLTSINQAYQAGANDFITKPIHWTLLSLRVQHIPRASRAFLRQKELEEQLHQSQKMEAVGRLAGGVAHDFNNLLTVITGCAELLLEGLSEHEALRPEVEEIYQAAEQASALTRQLMAFSRKQMLQPKVLDLNPLLARMEKMLSRLIGEDIELVTVFAPQPCAIQADPGQLEQVIMNLAVNSRDAMPQGGRLTLEVASITVDQDSWGWQAEMPQGAYVVLTIGDTGLGMDEATKTRVFEPFFTTKERGKGTGLGLAMVHGIVNQSGGYILLDSEPGRGTTVRVYLPQFSISTMQDEILPDEEESLQVQEPKETIMLVEDDSLVRGVARKILQLYGYNIIEANNGEEALELGKKYPGPIHLLLTDIIMPGMNGRELADHWKLLHPETKVLYTSGYTENALADQGALEEEIDFSPKPYRLASLAGKVREVLNR